MADRALRTRLSVACLGALGVLVLAGCGSSGKLAVSVVSPDRQPVLEAEVAVAGTHVRGSTGSQGTAHLSGLRPGVYTVRASAPGYFAATTTLRVAAPAERVVVQLRYRPPLGTFVWNIGPDGMYWDEGTVTKSSVTATEYDWTCQRDPRTGKTVGGWTKVPGALPYAVAPGVVASEWTRRRFPADGPPRPPSGCSGDQAHRPAALGSGPFSG
jgi:hypothetical protein